jgi:hypothetical protein
LKSANILDHFVLAAAVSFCGWKHHVGSEMAEIDVRLKQ